MTDFITVADVDALLRPGWAGTGDAVLAVTMANAWLTAKITRPVPDPVPSEIKLAGAQVAKEAAAGLLYAAIETGVLSKSVEADGVSSSKTYSATARKLTAGESFAEALLTPWTRRQAIHMLKRI